MTISLAQEKQYGSRLHWAIFHSHVGFHGPRHGWITHVMAPLVGLNGFLMTALQMIPVWLTFESSHKLTIQQACGCYRRFNLHQSRAAHYSLFIYALRS